MRVLVISVHPDDETLGCGGTLLKHHANGDETYCAFVTDGNRHQKELIPRLNELYRLNEYFQMGFPEMELDDISLNKLIPVFSGIINAVKPDILYVPNRSDVHSDHRRSFEALIATTKSFRYPFIKKVLMFEVVSETDFAPVLPEYVFSPNVFVDISEFFDKKLEIISLFHSELMNAPLTRSVEAISSRNRYLGSLINKPYAEAFVLLKEIL